jgi:hypothetical protein
MAIRCWLFGASTMILAAAALPAAAQTTPAPTGVEAAEPAQEEESGLLEES